MSLSVDQLALQLSITPAQILDLLDELHMPASHLKSSLDGKQHRAVRERFEKRPRALFDNPDPGPHAVETPLGPIPGPDVEEQRLREFLLSGEKDHSAPSPRKSRPKPYNPFDRPRTQPRRKPAGRSVGNATEMEKQLELELDWAKREFDTSQRREWEQAGLGAHQAAVADQCRRLGLQPSDLKTQMGRYKMGQRLRNGESVGAVYARWETQPGRVG